MIQPSISYPRAFYGTYPGNGCKPVLDERFALLSTVENYLRISDDTRRLAIIDRDWFYGSEITIKPLQRFSPDISERGNVAASNWMNCLSGSLVPSHRNIGCCNVAGGVVKS